MIIYQPVQIYLCHFPILVNSAWCWLFLKHVTMVLLTFLSFALLVLGSLVQAQSDQTFNTPIPCCSVAVNTVPSSSRASWCSANKNTCVNLCGGQGQIASNGNNCDTVGMSWCNAKDGFNGPLVYTSVHLQMQQWY
jgi:hypothetical protein